LLPLRDENPTRRIPIVTIVLIVANIAIFVFVQPHTTRADTRFTYEHAAIPCELTDDHPLEVGQIQTGNCSAQFGPEVFPDKNVWLAVLASMFLHGSLLHVLGNMLFLWIFGDNVEDYLNPFGFAIFYVIAGIVSAAAFVLTNPNSVDPFVGASGAIAGLMGVYLVLWPQARVLIATFIPPFIFPLRAWVLLLIWFGLQFFTSPNSGVAWTAHVGGFVFGALAGLLFRAVHPPRVLPDVR
jgi:membrane associated rhomboid family serine protease